MNERLSKRNRCWVEGIDLVTTVCAKSTEVGTVSYRTAASRAICTLHCDAIERNVVLFNAVFVLFPRCSSVVRIHSIPSNEADARRYSTGFGTVSPVTFGDAIDLCMRFGKDIVDGKVQAAAL